MQPPIGNDPTTHYLGWEFFRDGSLTAWPPGRSTLLGPGEGSSIALTDSLSLLAVPLRVALRLFGIEAPFQYLGIWMFICFLLQALFAGLLLQRFCRHRSSVLIGCALFASAPVFVYRLGYGVVHSSQWLVLASFWLATDKRPRRVAWVLVAGVSVAVNPYLTAMVLIVFLSRQLFIVGQDPRQFVMALFETSITFGSVIGSSYLVGLFVYRGDTLAAHGFGDYSTNILSLVDSSIESPLALSPSWSRLGLVPNTPDGSAYQWEGFGFLGSGVLFLALLVFLVNGRQLMKYRPWLITVASVGGVIAWFGNISWLSTVLLAFLAGSLVTGVSTKDSGSNVPVAPLTVSALTSFGIAVTHQVHIGSMSYRIPAPEQLLAAFDFIRVSGRLIWITAYVLMLFIIIALDKAIKSAATVTAIGVFVLGVQLLDGADGYKAVRDFMSGTRTAATLTAPLWNDLAAKYQHVEFVNPGQRLTLDNPSPGQDQSNFSDDFWFAERQLWADLGEFAVRNKMSLNAFYFARNPTREYAKESRDQEVMVSANLYRDDTLYVFVNARLWNKAKLSYRKDDAIGLLNGVPILAPGLHECTDCSLGDLVPVSPVTE